MNFENSINIKFGIPQSKFQNEERNDSNKYNTKSSIRHVI